MVIFKSGLCSDNKLRAIAIVSLSGMLVNKTKILEIQIETSNVAHSFVNSYKPTLYAFNKHQILKRLAKNKDIVIFSPGKVSGTVTLNRDDYIKKLFDIISETSKFKKLSADPTLLREL